MPRIITQEITKKIQPLTLKLNLLYGRILYNGRGANQQKLSRHRNYLFLRYLNANLYFRIYVVGKPDIRRNNQLGGYNGIPGYLLQIYWLG